MVEPHSSGGTSVVFNARVGKNGCGRKWIRRCDCGTCNQRKGNIEVGDGVM